MGNINPLTTNVNHHIETSQLLCIANQLTGFYMIGNVGRYWVKYFHILHAHAILKILPTFLLSVKKLF